MTKYYVTGGSDQYWQPTKARTLRGAMRVAMSKYQLAFNGRIEVAELIDEQYCVGAVRRGFGAWDTEGRK